MPSETTSIITAIIVLTLISSLIFIFPGTNQDLKLIPQIFLFSVIIIFVYVFSKKALAYLLDADVTHEIWNFSRYGFVPHHRLKKPVPLGILIPILVSLFSIGFVKMPLILTYETKALKARASKRFGFYSYSEMTEWHNALIGAIGIISLLILAILTYFLPVNLEHMAKLAIYFAFFNLIPFSKLDGTQIFFGSRILWITLAIITSVFAFFALLII